MPSDVPVTLPTTTRPDQAVEPDQLAAELLAQAYAQLPATITASFCLSLLVVVVLRGSISFPVLLAWLLTIWLITGLRFILYFFYRRAEVKKDNDRWMNLFLVGLLAAGLAWGSAGVILFADDSPVLRVFLAFVLGGLVAGSTTSLASLQVPLRIFIFLLMAPLALRFYLADGEISLFMSLTILLYSFMNGFMSARIHRIIRSTITLRLVNQEEIASRKKAEESLNQYKSQLEQLVIDRTEALSRANEELIQEISERKKAEDEKNRVVNHLLHTQKMEAIGTLAGGIAHDFNNILSIIIGYTELVLEELPDSSRLKADLQEVFTAAHRGKNLVRQIVQFSRKDHRKPEVIEPHEFIDDLQKLLRATIPTSVEIKTELDRECGSILIDPNQMHGVLTNLATNAVHAMEEKGVLTFSLSQVQLDKDDPAPLSELPPGPYARISVSDTGAGIDSELRERIFEPFFTTKEVDKGTGLGLAVVHGIVASNQGSITVDSEPGQGSTFHLFFPITKLETGPAVEINPDPPSGRERILVVDDDRTIAEMTGRLLTGQGYQVSTCNGGPEALQRFRDAPDSFDLVVTDQTMPGMTGLELSEELLNIRPDLPVILCTGYSSKISTETTTRTKIKEVLMKPVAREVLARRIRVLLDQRPKPTPS